MGSIFTKIFLVPPLSEIFLRKFVWYPPVGNSWIYAPADGIFEISMPENHPGNWFSESVNRINRKSAKKFAGCTNWNSALFSYSILHATYNYPVRTLRVHKPQVYFFDRYSILVLKLKDCQTRYKKKSPNRLNNVLLKFSVAEIHLSTFIKLKKKSMF